MPDKYPIKPVRIEDDYPPRRSKLKQIAMIARGLLLFGLNLDLMNHYHYNFGINMPTFGVILIGTAIGIGVRNLLPN